jgi:ATP-binding cassette subfamily B protein
VWDRVGAWLAASDPRRIPRSPQWLAARIATRVSPWLAVLVIAEVLLNALSLPLFAIASAQLVGAIPGAFNAGTGSDEAGALYLRLGFVGAAYLLQVAVLPLLGLASQAFSERFGHHLTRRAMTIAAGQPGIAHLEDPSVLDQFHRAAGLTTGYPPGPALLQVVQVWTMRLGGVMSAVVLLSYRWWVVAALLAVPLAQMGYWRRVSIATTETMFGQGQLLRRSAYLRDLALTPRPAAEIRVFGLLEFLSERCHRLWEQAMVPVWRSWRSGSFTLAVMETLFFATTIGAFVLIVADGLAGRLTLTEVALFMAAASRVGVIAGIGDHDFTMHAGLAAVPELLELEKRLPLSPLAGEAVPAGVPRSSIAFEGVEFTYPGRDRPVFEDFNLELRVGESTAIVGENGAGKTTLVKLLARLYEPTAGRVTIDGVDIASFETTSWQRRVAAIFQTFARFDLSARENVGLGSPEHQTDLDRVVVAAERAGIATTLAAGEGGWDTPLSRQRTGGRDLSGGQWQRVALARALFAAQAGARVLVLDEPTAALDVRAEAEFYDRFLDITEGMTTVVISHRFSTVRKADRIVVIDDGRVVEDGSHEQLVALGGRYAAMYGLQASRFNDDDVIGLKEASDDA